MSHDDVMSRQDQSWVKVQQRVFTNWVNTYLSERIMQIASLETDFQSGLNLIALLEIISSKELPPHNKKIRVKNQCLENLTFCLNFLRDEGIRLVNIAPEDIYDGNLKLILGLIWTIILRYQIQVEEGKSAKNDLLEWVRSKIPDYNINNFTNDWTSGKPICALANAVEPGLFNLPHDFSNNPLSDCNMGIQTAKQRMNIPNILLPEDMVEHPDELSNMTYISYFRDYERKKASDQDEAEKLKIPVAKFCTAYGPGLEGGEALVPTYFTVEARNYKNQLIPDVTSNPFDVAIQGPNGIVNHHLEPLEPGKFRVDYTPTKEGNHKIPITLHNDHISKSPYQVKINPANADPNQCRVWGSGVEDGDANKEKEVFVEPRNAHGDKLNLDNLPLNIKVKGPHGDVPVDLKKRDDGVYVGKYNPEDPGKYDVDVNLGKVPVANSPYHINIDRGLDESDPTKTWADGPGLEPGNKSSKPCHFTIHSVDKLGQPRRVGGDKFDVFIEDPDHNLIDPQIVDNNDGTYGVTYQPTNAGKYHVDVVQRHKNKPLFYDHISNSPVDVVIEPGIDASQCIAYGPGLEDGVKDTEPTHFTIQARDGAGKDLAEGGAPFDVKIKGPEGDIKPKVTDNQDGTYTVEYEPTKAGPHKVDVNLEGTPIKGAPFTVNVKHGADHSKSFVERFTFLIRTRDREGKNRTSGGDKVTVTITDPNNHNVEGVECRDIGDGTYLVVYSLPEDGKPGDYIVHCFIDGKDIKGSPWKQVIN